MRQRKTRKELEQLLGRWRSQAELDLLGGSRRELRAVDVVNVIDDLLETRQRMRARDLLAGTGEAELTEAGAVMKIISGCATAPDEAACCALMALRRLGWNVEALVADNGLELKLHKNRETTMPKRTIKVRAAEGLKVPKEDRPREYIEQEPFEIETSEYYIRRLGSGELIEIKTEAPAAPTRAGKKGE